MEFSQYLINAKINAAAFEQDQTALFRKLEGQFGSVGPKSFELQKKFYLNKWRLEYPLESENRKNL